VGLAPSEAIRFEAFPKCLAVDLYTAKIAAVTTCYTQFGTLGKDRHFPSGELKASRTDIAANSSRPACFLRAAFIAANLRDIMED
jgi:hypothetical protein